jgi:uncharacterized protein (DUF1810 family)
MTAPHSNRADGDPFELARFLKAQESTLDTVLTELRGGRKRSHWMWYVFPQVEGLGYSATARHYAIKSLDEARAYLAHPVLGARLRDCAEAVAAIEGRSAQEIFGSPDDLKLCSSMTLFERVAEPGSVFSRVIERFYGGERDARTLAIVSAMGGKP